jgi:hypothetical protein
MLKKRGMSGGGADFMRGHLGGIQASQRGFRVIYSIDASVLEVAAGRFPGLKGSRPRCVGRRIGLEEGVSPLSFGIKDMAAGEL